MFLVQKPFDVEKLCPSNFLENGTKKMSGYACRRFSNTAAVIMPSLILHLFMYCFVLTLSARRSGVLPPPLSCKWSLRDILLSITHNKSIMSLYRVSDGKSPDGITERRK